MKVKNLIKTQYFCYSKNANRINVDKCRNQIIPSRYYLLNVSNENSRARYVICSKLTKNIPEWPHWHEELRNIDVALVSLCLFLIFHSWLLGSAASWIYQWGSKYRQVTIMKHARTDANYPILTKWVRLKNGKKLVSSLKSIKGVALSNHLRNLLRSSFCMNNFFTRKNHSGNNFIGHHW